MYEMSGSLLLRSGVGTQIEIASHVADLVAGTARPSRSDFTSGSSSAAGDVADVGAPRVHARDPRRVDVEADHAEAGLRELDREREPDVAEADDADAWPTRDSMRRSSSCAAGGESDSFIRFTRRVTLLARLRGWSTSHPRRRAIQYARSCSGTTFTIGERTGSTSGTTIVASASSRDPVVARIDERQDLAAARVRFLDVADDLLVDRARASRSPRSASLRRSARSGPCFISPAG